MKPYIPKQPRQTRERIEAKLDAQLARKLESYCEYLESDRDYVVTQALELVFRKDKGFVEWLGSRARLARTGPAPKPDGNVRTVVEKP